jgi:hypothetical protein
MKRPSKRWDCISGRSVYSEGNSRPGSQHESVRDVGAGRVDDVLKIGLETEPGGKLDLICCLQTDFVARI